jgi:hypothetical protein
MSDNQDRIVITNDDLNAPKINESVQAMKEASAVSTVRTVGAPAPTNAGSKAILLLTGAGIAGGILTFGVIKASYASFLANVSTTTSNLAFTFIMAFVIGLTVAIIDAASTKIAAKIGTAAGIAIPVSMVSGLAIGAAANAFYSSTMQKILNTAYARVAAGDSEASALQYIKNSTHLPRGIAWLLVGIAAGLTVGIASRSLKRTGLTVAGGAVGGFIGGFVFDFIPGEAIAQLIGITITGLLIGLSMALLEQAARTQWIEIIEGGMAGKQFILYKSDITIGSAPSADITLIKDPSISPIHARIYAQGGRSYIQSLDASRPVSINGVVGMQVALEDSVYITVGSTKVLFREKAGASKTVSGSVGRLS